MSMNVIDRNKAPKSETTPYGEIRCVSNPHPYVETAIDCSDKSIDIETCKDWELRSHVDQAGALSADVNVIVNTYARQGVFGKDIPGRVGQFLDNTKIPSFQEAFDILQEATDLFEQLPVEVRKAMDHDPSQMETFLTNKDNHDMLYKYGVLERKKVVDPDDAPLDKKTFKEAMKSPKESTKKD